MAFSRIPLGTSASMSYPMFRGQRLFLIAKQAVNGIANALLARLLFSGYSLRRVPPASPSGSCLRSAGLFVLGPARSFYSCCQSGPAETDPKSANRFSRQQTFEYSLKTGKKPKAHILHLAKMPQPFRRPGCTHLEHIKQWIPISEDPASDGKADIVAIDPLRDEWEEATSQEFRRRPYIPTLKEPSSPCYPRWSCQVGQQGPMVAMWSRRQGRSIRRIR